MIGKRVFFLSILIAQTIRLGAQPSSAQQNWLDLPLGFERQGSGPRERYVAQGNGYMIGLEKGRALIALPASGTSAKDSPGKVLSLEFTGGNAPSATPRDELPGKVNRYQGNDPTHWQIGLSTWREVAYPQVYPGIDVVYYGNQKQLEFDFIVQPGADPRAIRMKIGGARKLELDASGALSIDEGGRKLQIALPAIYQEIGGTRKKVAGHYVLKAADEVAFAVESWDRSQALVIDPTLVYSGLVGGGTNSSFGYGIAVDSSGNIYLTGYTYATDFPAVNAAQQGLAVTPDGFVTKINAAGTAFVYSTFLGGSNSDFLRNIAADSTGAAWVTGQTQSTDFPLMNPTQSSFGGGEDAVVAKFSATGSLIFSTYLGGSGFDYGLGVATDSSNNAYIAGYTGSSTFPTTSGALQTTIPGSASGFVTKFSSTAALVYSTFLGGTSYDYPEAIAVDSAGNAYVTGQADSSSFNGAPGGGAQSANAGGGDAFIAKLNPAGSALVYFTFLGGTGYDYGEAIALDSSNNAYIAGSTTSAGLATTGAAQTTPGGGTDGFIAKLNATGSAFTYVTYYGGNRQDYPYGLGVDSAGNAYVGGSTDSNVFPNVAPLLNSFPGNPISLYQTLNTGSSWTAFDSALQGAVSDISADPVTSGTIVAVTESGIYRTTNGGTSWTQVFSGGNGTLLARSPSTPSTLYAFEPDNIYETTDDGVTWIYKGNSGTYFNGLVVDPLTSTTVYGFYNNTSTGGVFVSTNSGATFTAANTGLPSTNVYALVATSDGSLYASVYGSGIYKSTNHGTSWVSVNNASLPSPGYFQQHSLATSGTTIYAAYGTIYKSTNGGTSWSALPGTVPSGAYIIGVSPANPSIIYAAGYSGSNSVYVSADGGTTYTPVNSGLSTVGSITEFAFDPLNSSRAFLVAPVSQVGFVAELNPTGSALTYSTFFGPAGGTTSTPSSPVLGLAANASGDAFITGYSFGGGTGGVFPSTTTAFSGNTTYGAFVSRISPTTAACSVAVRPASQDATGYSQTLGLSAIAPSGCAWSATSNQTWATITRGASDSGVDAIDVQLALNTTGAERTATISTGSGSATITQADSGCSFVLSPSTFSLAAAGGAISTTLTTGSGCPWMVTDSYPFAVSVTSASSGTGTATINLSVATNYNVNAQNYYLTVGTASLTINQAAACTFTLNPTSASFALAGGSGSIAVTGSAGSCPYTATTTASWITLTGGTTGTGTGTVTYSIAANSGSSTRTGTITIGNATFTVTQYGTPVTCSTPTSAPALVRGEGTTELVGNLSFTCSGSGGTANISVNLSPGLPVTSEVLNSGTGQTEALAVTSSGYTEGTVSAGTVYFTGVPIPSGSGVTVTIANIRVNASSLSVGLGAPPSISESVFVSGTNITSAALPNAIVAYAEYGLGSQTVTGLTNLPALNKIPATSGPAFSVNFGENFANAFKVQGNSSNALNASPYSTETGYSANGTISNIATAGTRVQITFSNVPANLSMYVPTTVTSSTGDVFQLTASATGAFSALSPITPTNVNTLPSSPALGGVTIVNGTGAVYYELTNTNASAVASFTVPVYIATNVGVLPTTVPITAAVSFAPIGSTEIPNFVVASSTVTLTGSSFTAIPELIPEQSETIVAPRQVFSQALILPFVSNQVGYDTEITISNTSQDTSGSTQQSGTCTLNFYGSGAPSPSSVTLASFAAGTQRVFYLSQYAAGFQGYIIVSCGFPLARANARVFDGSTSGYLSQNEVAQIIAVPRLTSTPQRILIPFATNQAGFDTGIAIANTSLDPFGTTATSGACTLTFYGSGAPSPNTVTTASIAAGTVYAVTVSSVAPGFQGYIAASCNFSAAAAYSFVTNGIGSTGGTSLSVTPEPITIPRTSTPQPLLYYFLSNQTGADTGIAISNTSTDPYGSGLTPTAGTCTLNFYGSGAPAAVTTPNILSGTVYTLALSSVAPGFQGYMTATCTFPQARGFAYVLTSNKTNISSEIPEVVTTPRNSAGATSTSLLFSKLTNTYPDDTAIAISNTSLDSFGTTPSAGTCKISYFGSNAPVPQMSTSIAAGSQLTFTLSGGNAAQGIGGAPGFSGYAIADCNFPLARGVADFYGFPAGVPSITTTTLPTGETGSPYSQTLTASGGAPPYTFSYQGTLQQGLSLNSAGVLSGTPTQTATSSITVTVTDSLGYTSAGRGLQLTTLSALTISTTALPNGNPGVSYSQTLAATGGSTPYSWTLASGSLPAGLTLSAAGVISGTPTATGSFPFTVKVTDSLNYTTTQTLTLQIGATLSLPIGPTLGPYPVGPNQLTIQLSATGGTPPYHYSLTPGATVITGMRVQDGQPLPTSFPSTVTGGYLGVLGPGSYSTSLRVTDATNATSDSPISFSVLPIDIVTVGNFTPAILNTSYSFQMTAYGGSGSYIWSATNLPAGLSINASTGLISGTPTATGNFSPTISLADAAGGGTISRSRNSISVYPFAITDNALLPQATALTPYSYQLHAPGCGTGCTWSVASGSILTSGFTLSSSGLLSGTYTGASGFVDETGIQATGSNGTTQKVITLEILPTAVANLQITTTINASTVLGTTAQRQLFASGGTVPYTFSVVSGTLPPGISLQGPTSNSIFGAPDYWVLIGSPQVAGTYNFTIQVTDAANRTATQAFTWQISLVDLLYTSLPITTPVSNPLIYNQPYSQQMLVIGGTGNYTSFTTAAPIYPGLSLNSSTGVVSGTPTNTGTNSTLWTITDSAGNTETTGVSITAASNATTTITISGLTSGSIVPLGASSTYTLTPSGGTAPYTIASLTPLPAGFTILGGDSLTTSPGTGSYILKVAPQSPGTYTFTLQATDANGVTGEQTYSLVVPGFSYPDNSSLPDGSVGAAYSALLYSFDSATGLTVSVAAGSALPPGLTLSTSGTLSGTPTAAGTYSFGVSFADSFGTSITTYQLRISSIAVTSAKVLPVAILGTAYSDQLASTGGAGTVTWSATGLPSGLTISTAGLISGIPTAAGTFSVTITATDGVIPVAGVYALFVRLPNPGQLSVSTAPLSDASLNQFYFYNFSPSGGVGPYTVTLASGSTLPPGLSLVPSGSLTGAAPGSFDLIGVPSATGGYQFSLVFTDSAGSQITLPFTLNVRSVNLVTGNPVNAIVNVAYMEQLTATGGTGPYTFTIAPSALGQQALPNGLTMSSTGLISGTPTSTGRYTFILTATDSTGATYTRQETLICTNSSGLYVSSTNFPYLGVGIGASQSFTTAGGSSTYTWSLIGGSLPPGTFLRPSGTSTFLGGQATTPGTYTFTLRATDNANSSNFADHIFTQTVGAAQIVSPADESIATLYLPPAQLGVAYSQTLRAAGGVPPYTFSESPFTPDLLPAGITLNSSGVLSGTPTDAGVYFVRPFVTDSTGNQRVSFAYQLVVTTGGPAPLLSRSLNEFSNLSAGVPFTFALDRFVAGGTPPYTWTGTGLPAGLAILPGGNGVSSYLAGTVNTAGSYTATLAVSDSGGQTLTSQIPLTVSPLALSPTTIPNGIVGTPYSVSLLPSGGAGPYTIGLGVNSDLPPGLTLNSSGLLSGTPAYAGNFILVVTVTDNASNTLSQVYEITIDDAAGEAPALSASPNPINITYSLGTAPPATTLNVASTSSPLAFSEIVSGIPGATLTSGGSTTPANPTLNLSASQAVGTYSGLVAVQSPGSANYGAAIPVTLVVTPAGTCTTTLTSSANPSAIGQSITLTASVSCVGATGAITFRDGYTSLGSVTLTNGSASLTTATLSGGSHSLTAAYSGDSNFSSGTSNVLTQIVNLTATSTSLTSSLNPSVYGQNVTLTATVSPSAATGTVSFRDGSTVLGSITLSSGTASFSTSTLSAGSHSLTAVYSGDANNAASASASVSQSVTQVTSTIGITSTQNPSTQGQSVTFTATVTPSAATGSVTFYDGTTALGSLTLSGGSPTFTTSALSVGSHSITAVYSGDVNDAGSRSSVLTQQVNIATTGTVLSSSANPSTYGAPVTLTATVTPSTATGLVTFKDGSATLGTGTLSSGVATLTLSTLTAGTHALTAVYAGDANDAANTSPVLSQGVNQAATTTYLTPSPNPSTLGQSVTLTATVVPAAATGSVTFFDGSASLGSAALSNGAASIAVSTLTAGPHSLTANYSGDSNFSGSVSAGSGPALFFTSSVPGTILDSTGQGTGFTTRLPGTGSALTGNDPNLTLNPANGTLTWQTTSADLNGQVNLASGDFIGFPLSSAGVALNQDFTLSATFQNVQFSQSYDQLGLFVGTTSANAFRGGLLFSGGASAFSTQTVNGVDQNSQASSSLAPSPGDTVTFTLSRTSGTWALTVTNLTHPANSGSIPVVQPAYLNGVPGLVAGVFTGNVGNQTVKTETLSSFAFSGGAQTVLGPSTTVTSLASSPNPAALGQTVTLTATVSPLTATGTVTFLDGSTTLGTATLSGGTATFSASTLALGSHSLTASYAGDSSDTASVSSVVMETVTLITTNTSLAATPNPATIGAAVTLTATVSPATATGAVTFRDGSTTLSTVTLASGAASFSTAALAVGTHSLTASYSGDSSNAASVSSAVAETVNLITTNTSLAATPNPSMPGQTVTLTATVSPSAATGTVTFKDGSATLGTGTLSSGTATFSTATLTSGSHSLTATYGGDTLDNPSTSSAVSLQVGPTTTTVTLTSSLNPSIFAQNVVFTATVKPTTATGTITFNDGTASLGAATLSGGAATFATAGLTAGTHSITASYGGDTNDAVGVSSALTQTVNKAATTTTLTSSPNPSTAGQSVTLRATVTPQGATGSVTFADSGVPLGAATLSLGAATFTTSFTAGSHALTASYAGDTNNAASVSSPLSQTATLPTLTIVPPTFPTGTVGQPYGPVSFSATGGSGVYTWSGSGVPQGLSFSSNGVLSGTPTAASSGSLSVKVTDVVSQATATGSFTITILAPTLTLTGPSSLGSVLPGASISASFTASGGAPPYSFSASGLAGIAIDNSGHLTGKAGSPGSYTVTVTVTDSQNAATTRSLSLSVFGITSSGLPPGSTGMAYSASVSATGGTPPYSFSASGLPPGITFSGGAFGGTPTTAGTYSVAVQAQDSTGLSASATYSLTIASGTSALSVFTSSLTDAVAGQPYSGGLNASGGTSPYTWSQSGGVLPAGISLSSSGAVTGLANIPGAYSFGVRVTDSANNIAVGSVSLNVDPAPLQITNGATFPSGIAGADYPAQIVSASGGTPPYNITVTGSLPTGLTLSNSQIAGTPTTAGVYGFTLKASDSATPPATGVLGVSLTVRPAIADLVVASSSVAFSIAAGTSSPPSANSVGVSSSVLSQNIGFTSAATVPWLSVSGGSTTPGVVSIALNSAALALTAAGSPYSGSVTLTCTSPSCNGNMQTVAVTLTVTSPPPLLSLGASLLSFASLTSNPLVQTGSIPILNTGGGQLKINSITSDSAFLTVGTVPATVAPGPGASVTVTVNPAGLQAGYYRATVTVSSSGGNASAVVTLFVAGAATITLSPSGSLFTLPQGGALGNNTGSFSVNASNGASVPFTASVISAPWLSVTNGSGTASTGVPAVVSYSIDPTAAAAFAVGSYYGTIRVTASGVVDSPQDYQVVLNVTPSTTPVLPDPEPAGLVFVSAGNAPVPSQTITVYASSRVPIPFQASASVDTGAYLSITPSTGTTSAGSPATVTVSVNPAGLQPGAYRATVAFAFGSAVRAVNVTLIVEPSSSGHLLTSSTVPRASGPSCANAQLVPTETSLASNFSVPTSWPTPLTVQLFDTCGSAVNSAQMVATFTNNDPPLPLTVVDAANGIYSATWTPRGASSNVTITALVSASGYPGAQVKIAGQAPPNSAPVLAPNGAGDVFDPQVGAGLGPGNIIQIYGSGLATTNSTPVVLPLPTAVVGTQVIIGGVAAPLYYVSPTQVNAQIPFGLAPGNQYQLLVSANGALTTPLAIQLNNGAPTILNFTSGAVEAQHLDGTLVTATSPAMPGEYIVIYSSGLGATDIPVASGAPSPSNPVANVANPPVLTLNGNPIPILFAGLTPGLVGLYQVNFQVPPSLTTGNYNLALTQSGTSSNTTVLPVAAPQ